MLGLAARRTYASAGSRNGTAFVGWTQDFLFCTRGIMRERGAASGTSMRTGCTSPGTPSTSGREDGPHHTGASPKSNQHICILGGGVGGLNAAIKLETMHWPHGCKPQISLVDTSERFVFKPLLYELLAEAADEEEVAPRFRELLQATSVTFVKGEPIALYGQRKDGQQQERTLQTENLLSPSTPKHQIRVVLGGNHSCLDCDWLVLALGARPSVESVPGVAEHAHLFWGYQDAIRLRDTIRRLKSDSVKVAVVGAGYAGTEVAAVLVDLFPRGSQISLLAAGEDILPGAPEGQRDIARDVLREKGIKVLTQARVCRLEASSADAAKHAVVLDAPSSLADGPRPADYLGNLDLVVWTAGSHPEVHKLVQGSQKDDAEITSNDRHTEPMILPTNERGAILTDESLRLLGHQNVFALGDIAVVQREKPTPPAGTLTDNPKLPATAQVALQEAECVANNIFASICNRPLEPFRYRHLGEMMSLGRLSGAVTLPIPLPPPLADTARYSPAVRGLLRALGFSVHGSSDEGAAVSLEGPLAAAVRRLTYMYRQPTPDAQGRAAVSIALRTLGDLSGLACSVVQQVRRGVDEVQGKGTSAK